MAQTPHLLHAPNLSAVLEERAVGGQNNKVSWVNLVTLKYFDIYNSLYVTFACIRGSSLKQH